MKVRGIVPSRLLCSLRSPLPHAPSPKLPPTLPLLWYCDSQVAALALCTVVSAAPYSFITFGDWGTGSTLQKDGAAAVNAFCATPGACEQVIGLAECVTQAWPPPSQRSPLLLHPLPCSSHCTRPRSNFYNGPLTTEDPRWRTDFQDMYNFCKFSATAQAPAPPLALTPSPPSSPRPSSL
jgi:hypothetical protein